VQNKIWGFADGVFPCVISRLWSQVALVSLSQVRTVRHVVIKDYRN